MFKIITLMENTKEKDFLHCEPGFSVMVETEAYRLVYDTGLTARCIMNARQLGKDLNGLDALVLSHGHDDHTGGAAAILLGYGPGELFIGEGFFEDRYGYAADGLRDEGTLLRREMAECSSARCTVVSDKVQLSPGIFLIAGFPRTNDIEHQPGTMFRMKDGELIQDEFSEELALVLQTDEELCVISGCSHSGILNILDRVSGEFCRPVTMFIGGTHLMEADRARIEATCRELKRIGLKKLGACHCTGAEAISYFADNFPGFFFNKTGTSVEI